MLRKSRSSTAGTEEDNEINLTPMLDVVFIMLIFFIVTATFIKEAGIDVDRPYAMTRDQMADAAILVAISPEDKIWIDKNEVDPKDVRTVIEKLHHENPKGSLVIQADSDSTNESLVVVMEAAKAAGVANVAVSAADD
jgi:biopolymer transport protein ExbD